ncbi:2-hydroxyacid dehydrogenase [Mucilaginibacter paludis]|uniref:D-isomer specific 2-hydroxyacid dehydrogenase NAD-binding n=1 Tax=Mucilaginibacter paludis DSM 18603 TaxID=714943 RepID=H1YJ13_9SPHI|nr:2-hydroxyacid dehydrogenase [Mucilaginibacter paludis]EHQ27708.1 D-isomer specific 2-hydroxyacid dehydrogenase NAD-binding [Mucilaginibacter paludis DSM 18603]
MKAVAYSIKPFEKEFLAKANQKKHDITLISNPLSLDTVSFAEGKNAVIVFSNDDVSAPVIEKLAALGIKYIATRTADTEHIDTASATRLGIKISNVPSYPPDAIAEHAVALAFALNRHLITADQHSHLFDFRNDDLVGFNFADKTVGIIGMGNIGQLVSKIFSGLGCKVLGYDIHYPETAQYAERVTLANLLTSADIISLHVPLTPFTRHIINKDTLDQMKDGVMLINTSKGAVIDTIDVMEALDSGKIGYLGLDVYEYENGLFFEDHEDDTIKDTVLQTLMRHKNVLVTPHQAYLTKETLQTIANQTISNLDLWQQNKCVGDACVCSKNCQAIPVNKKE